MGKYNLGKANITMSTKMNKGEVALDEQKADDIIADLKKQYDILQRELSEQQVSLKKAVKQGAVKGAYAKAFEGWAKVCKEQAANSKKRSDSLDQKYKEDVKDNVVVKLSKRVSELEEKIQKFETDKA